MPENQAALGDLLDALHATGVSDQVRATLERTYCAVTATEASAAAELPPAWPVEIKECSYYRGRFYVAGHFVCPEMVDRVLVGAPPWTSLTELSLVRDPNSAVHFEGEVELDATDVPPATLFVRTLDGAVYRIGDLAARGLYPSRTAEVYARFQNLVSEMSAPKILEIGARARTGVFNEWVPEGSEYVGFDIVADSNVDVVGDAHRMSAVLPAGSFDAAFSLATFEHLAMPWVVAVELNKVLKVGAYVFVVAPQTWPLHEAPWDFYRFSEYAWATIFNKYSGFEVVEAAGGEPAKVIPHVAQTLFLGMEIHPGYLGSVVLARKIGETSLQWDVQVDEVIQSAYPD